MIRYWPNVVGWGFVFSWISLKATQLFGIDQATTFVMGTVFGFVVGIGVHTIHGGDASDDLESHL